MKTRQVYFIHTFPRRRELGESFQTCCVNVFFPLADILREKNPYFGKYLFFAIQELMTLVRIHVKDFATGENKFSVP